MKKTLLSTIAASVFVLNVHGQAAIEWQQTFGGTNFEDARSVTPTPDGGFIMAGHAQSSDIDLEENNGSLDYWIVKTNAMGEMEWQKDYGGIASDMCFTIINTSEGGYIVSGTASSGDGDVVGNHGPGLSDFWVIKLETDGDIEWKRCYGGTGFDNGYAIIETTDGGFAFSGGAGSEDGDVSDLFSAPDAWLVKIEQDGDIEWEKTYGGIGGENGYSLVQADDGGYVVAGESSSWDSGVVTGNHGSYNFWVFKTEPDGDLLWQKSFGGSGQDIGRFITKTAEGGYAITGSSGSNDGDVTTFLGTYDFWLVVINDDGDLLWQKSYGGYDDEKAFCVDQTSDGGFVMTGFSMNPDADVTFNHGDHDIWVVKTLATGEIEWQKSYGGGSVDNGYSIQQINPTDYIVAGTTGSLNGDVTGMNGLTDFWLLKLSVGDGVEEAQVQDVQVGFSPNPFSAFTRCTITGKNNFVSGRFELTDVLGKIVYSKNLTTASFLLEKGDLQQEVYFYSVLSDGGQQLASGKLVAE